MSYDGYGVSVCRISSPLWLCNGAGRRAVKCSHTCRRLSVSAPQRPLHQYRSSTTPAIHGPIRSRGQVVNELRAVNGVRRDRSNDVRCLPDRVDGRLMDVAGTGVSGGDNNLGHGDMDGRHQPSAGRVAPTRCRSLFRRGSQTVSEAISSLRGCPTYYDL